MNDNPCWGGCQPNQHDLEYLLHVLGSPLPSSTTMLMTSATAATDTTTATDHSLVSSVDSIAASAAASSSLDDDDATFPATKVYNDDGQNGALIKSNSLSKFAPSPFRFCSPEEHTSFIHRIHTKLILYHDEHYIVINKPPDLRMDGPYKATVHKLLLYLFPPPSLISINATKNTDNIEYINDGKLRYGNDEQHPSTTAVQNNHTQLLHSIYPLSSHTSLPDDPFRMVHQLDYATSGVLLIGKTRKATAAACKAFEERKTTKKYVAVVTNQSNYFATTTTSNSSISPPPPPLGQDFFNNLPVLDSSSLNAWSDGSLELQYRKKRQRESNTVTYLPIHSVFDKWRSAVIRTRKKERELEADGVTPPRSRKSHIHNILSTLPPPPLPLPTLKVTLTCEEEEELLSLGTSWKAVKSNILAMGGDGVGDESDNAKKKWIDIIETMAIEYNQALGGFYAEQKLLDDGSEVSGNNMVAACSGLSLPPMFRISSADDHTASEDDSNNSFYICAPIGEVKGRFHVIVDPSISLSERDRVMNYSNTRDSNGGGVGNSLPPLRPALTKCTVLTRGYYSSSSSSSSSHGNNNKQRQIPVAKVLLQPWTGRRHQLRVHMANVVGCPILGDIAYDGSGDVVDPNAPGKNNNHESTIANSYKERRLECGRMCLHAKELTIQLMDSVSKTFIAKDPFVFEDERLRIS